MPTCLQFALSNPVAGREDEFNRWYEHGHLRNGVLTPGILAGQRFRRADGPWPSGKHEYLTIWEIDDPAFALAQLASVKGTDAMPKMKKTDPTGDRSSCRHEDLRVLALNWNPRIGDVR